ncbi:MAG: hypothetical protein EOM34_00325 [Clostridia bacterium]|nr:hypothetical protein [Lachnospiraceae bacterium]NCB99111.1 hypothetical protein [Clostridia bacterium]NCD02167.1 hypothetical protein [Clostridia bacterium]
MRKCYVFKCQRYPKCAKAAGSVCGLDDYNKDGVISAEECYEREDKPEYVEKTNKKYGLFKNTL